MQIRNWHGKKVGWGNEDSIVGWVTRAIVLAALVLAGFCLWVLPTQFASEHPKFTQLMIGVYIVDTIYIVARMYFEFEVRHMRPKPYSLHHAFGYEGSVWKWIQHKTVPFGYWGHPAAKVYGIYSAFVCFCGGGYYFIERFIPWYNTPKKPEPEKPPTDAQIWFEHHWYYVLGAVALILMLMIAPKIISSIKRWHHHRFVKPHVDKLNREVQERAQKISDEARRVTGHADWALGYTALTDKYRAEHEANKQRQASLVRQGELIALAVQLLKKGERRRGDGDIGEARMIMEHVLAAILLPDETARQAALFRAIQNLEAADRQRFQPPKKEVAA